MIVLVKVLVEVGFSIEVICGMVIEFYDVGIMSIVVNKMFEGCFNIVDVIKNGEYVYLINIIEGC